MALEISTIDCTLVSDSELEEMSDMCVELQQAFSVGFLSKEAESWVLLSRTYEKGALKGFSFYTLERLGGTPCVIMGSTSILRISKRHTILKQIIKEQKKRVAMAFPDEDVLFGARLTGFSGLELFSGLKDLIPRPGHKSNGEERAWGRRLAGKYGLGAKDYSPTTSIAKGDGGISCSVDYESLRLEKLDKSMKKLFTPLDGERGDSLIFHGWVKAADLTKLA